MTGRRTSECVGDARQASCRRMPTAGLLASSMQARQRLHPVSDFIATRHPPR
ncbi:hypothetical protein C7S14_2019 [Burkholderia cepacia]|nr:hypothetical protein C7S14_2019 [Burkholderia cepacia]